MIEYAIKPVLVSQRTGRAFGAYLVTSLTFPDRDSITYDEVSGWLDKHPLLQATDELPVYLLAYEEWVNSNGNFGANPPAAGSAVRRRTDLSALLSDLKKYFIGSNAHAAGYPAGTLPEHNAYLENLDESNFIDPNRAYETLDEIRSLAWTDLGMRLRSTDLGKNAGANVRAGIHSVLDQFISETISRHVYSGSASDLRNIVHLVQNSTLASSFFRGRNDFDEEVRQLADVIPKSAERARPIAEEALRQHARSQQHLARRLDETDLEKLNFLAAAAEKEELISRKCGFVTRWDIELNAELEEGKPYVLQLDHTQVNAGGIIVRPYPAVFRQTNEQTHPVAFRDLQRGKKAFTHTGLVCLQNNGERRYTVSDRNAELELLKSIYIQENNRVANPSNDPDNPLAVHEPDLTAQQLHEAPEPGSSGISISSPPEDLVTPKELQLGNNQLRRQGRLDCLYLEDLWIGYRLDIGERGNVLHSVHRFEQSVTHSKKHLLLRDETESYFERMQPDDSFIEMNTQNQTLLKQISDTAVVSYSGLSEGQKRDLRTLLGIRETRLYAPTPGNLIKSIESYHPVTRLQFGGAYSYRLRCVFQGAVSLPETATITAPEFSQDFKFRRPGFYRAGEIVAVSKNASNPEDLTSQQYFLHDDNREVTLTLAPTPSDVETSRLFGQWLRNGGESHSLRNMRHVTDLSKYFAENEVTEIDYFSDPDVLGFRVTCTILNGSSDPSTPRKYVFQKNIYCEITDHIEMPSKILKYEKRNKAGRRYPARIIISRTRGKSVKQVASHDLNGYDFYKVSIPESYQVKLVLEPWLGEEAEPNIVSTQNYAYIELFATNVANRPKSKPFIQWQEKDRIHASSLDHAIDTFSVVRDVESNNLEFKGTIEIDPPSSGAVQLFSAWSEIDDIRGADGYTLLTHAKPAEGGPRPVRFTPYEVDTDPEIDLNRANLLNPFQNLRRSGAPDRNWAIETLFDQVGKQTSESRIFYGLNPEPENTHAKEPPKSPGLIDLGDHKRKHVQVSAEAVARFRSKLPGIDQQRAMKRGNAITLDVQSAYSMTAPKVSHVLPITRRIDNTSAGYRKSFSDYGFRIYLERPWFESGIGERLAIGFANTHSLGKIADGFLVKRISQWGEDPFENLAARASSRLPRASDFRATEENNPPLDENLYPPVNSSERVDSRIYDNIPLEVADPSIEEGSLHLDLNSFAVRFDEKLMLWYADIDVSVPFYGWIGLALYRHQPHAVDGLTISSQPTWAYASVMYDEPLTVSIDGNALRFTIGPVFDDKVSYKLVKTEFRHGVATNTGGDSIDIQSYNAAGGIYYQGSIPPNEKFSLVKQLFGKTISMRELVVN